MPTGYTANVPDGITFEQFVWQCARGMGALVMMRDEPTGAPIPERFEPSDYNAKREIAYHTKAHQEEVERTEARNGWLAALRNSLVPNAEALPRSRSEAE